MRELMEYLSVVVQALVGGLRAHLESTGRGAVGGGWIGGGW